MSNQGIESARHVDHVGMTVPNLEEAIRFFEDALGGLLLWRVGRFHETATGVPINSVQIAITIRVPVAIGFFALHRSGHMLEGARE